jgi:hypothetical protein
MLHSIPGVSERTYFMDMCFHTGGGTPAGRRKTREEWLVNKYGCPADEVKTLLDWHETNRLEILAKNGYKV